MERLFGTDGVRGTANVHPVTAEMAVEIGRATAWICRKNNARPVIVIGKDTRISGDMLEAALTAGICSMGVDVLLAGVIPTPGVAYITRSMRADAGMVISASHNPYQDNGIKVFSRNGFKLPDAEEDEIEKVISSGQIRNVRPAADGIGRVQRIEDAGGRYIVFCKGTTPEDISLEGMRIVIDCANGAASRVAPAVFTELGAVAQTIHCEPNGININDHCGSQHVENLAAAVVENQAAAGLAFDGDGDRLIAVDERGLTLSGDQIIAICSQMYKELGLLSNNLVVATVMSNFGFFSAMKKLGVRCETSKVGDRYVMEKMLEKGSTVGGEQSGHVIFLNHHTTGDGIVTALQVLSAVRRSGRPLSDLAKVVSLSPQKIINVDVTSKPPLEQLHELQTAIKDAEIELGDEGRVLIRYSGTQSMCRVMVEGPNDEITGRLARKLADRVRSSIG